MFPSTFRRLVAGGVVVLACAAAAPATADAGTFTQLLCVDPATGQGVTPNGTLPDGFDNPSHYGSMNNVAANARCADGTSLHLPLQRSEGGRPHTGAALRYRAGASLSFRSARIWRQWSGAGNWAFLATRVDDWNTVPGHDDWCSGASGCAGRGTSSGAQIRDANLMTLTRGAETTNGFNLSALCDAGTACETDTASRGLYLHAGAVVLEDTSPPTASAPPTGALASNGTRAGTIAAQVAATDAGAGVYRVKVVVDDIVRSVTRLGAGTATCADARPGDEDPHQFAVRRPCPDTVTGAVELDTTTVPEGPATVRLVLEDAAGNETPISSRQMTIDNVPPPTATGVPVLGGVLRAGQTLTVVPATFDDHGLAGDPVITRRWERCRYDGSSCVDVSTRVPGLALTLGSDDLNRRFRVTETATNSEGTATAVSVLTAVVTRADGTLPPENDGLDNDNDGLIDEPGETNPGPGGGGGATSAGSDGLDGRNAVSTARSVTRIVSTTTRLNGEGAHPSARLTAAFVRGGANGRVAFGRSLGVRGKLADPSGRPIAGAVVEILETAAVRGAKPVTRSVTTGADGTFAFTASGPGGHGSVVVAYRHLRDGAVSAQQTLRLAVAAGVRFAVRLRGVTVAYSGRVLAGAMPRGGKLVIVQGRAKGGSWQTFASRRASRTGAFKGRYRLKVRRPGKQLQFRVRVLGESGWNYGAATSKAVTRTVR